ncbi:hypothetical protein E2320_002353, partial [Naja naja]
FPYKPAPHSHDSLKTIEQIMLASILVKMAGNYPSKFAFMAGTKTSTIDYILTSMDLLHYIENCGVLPYIESDHLL